MERRGSRRLVWIVGLAATLFLLVPASASALTQRVCPAPSTCEFDSVQAAVSDPDTSVGDTIQVTDGTYVEQVVVDKRLEIVGSGAASTVVRSPAALDSDGGEAAVVKVLPEASGSTIGGLTIDGDDRGSSSVSMIGILARNANVDISGVHVTNTRSPAPAVDQNGVGILVADAPSSVSVSDSFVDRFGAEGIRFEGPSTSASSTRDSVSGSGGLSQRGIVFADGAGGSIQDGNVGVLSSLPDTPQPPGEPPSAGIFLDGSSPVDVAGARVSSFDFGILAREVEEGTSRTSIADSRVHITNTGIEVVGGTGADVRGNTIFDSDIGIRAVFSAPMPEAFDEVTGNAIADVEVGVSAAGTDPFAAVHLLVSHNRLDGASTAIKNDTPVEVDAEGNWYGCNEGPNANGCSEIENSGGGSVDADPWAVLSVIAGPQLTIWEHTRVRAGLYFDSEGNCLSGQLDSETGLCVPLAFARLEPFHWSATGGRFDSGTTGGSGSSEAIFTGQELGPGSISVSALGGEASTPIEVVAPPPPVIEEKRRKLKPRRAAAILWIHVDQPGWLTARGRGIGAKRSYHAKGAATLRVPVKLTGEARRILRRDGRARVTVRLGFNPTKFGVPKAHLTTRITLKRKPRH